MPLVAAAVEVGVAASAASAAARAKLADLSPSRQEDLSLLFLGFQISPGHPGEYVPSFCFSVAQLI